jgi:hypothetical protein
VTASSVIPLDVNVPYFAVGLCVLDPGGGTYTVEHTFDDVWAANFNPATATWFPHGIANLVNATSTQDGNFVAPCTGVRVNQTVGAGTVTLVVIQQGVSP